MVVILIAFLLIVLPGIWLIGMLVGRAQDVAAGLVNSSLLARIQTLRVGQFEVGPQLAAIGKELITWLGGSALGFIGTATRFTLNLLFTFFGLYYLLLNPDGVWRAVAPYIPFSQQNVQILRERFVSLTGATVVGTGLVAVMQGTLVGARILHHRAQRSGVLGRGDHGVRHPPGGGRRAWSGCRPRSPSS